MSDIISFISAPKLVVAMPVLTDSHSQSRGTLDICGATTTTVTAVNAAETGLGYLVNGQSLEVTSEPPFEPMTIELERTTSLVDYPTVSRVDPFKVDYFLLETPPPIDDLVYTIGSGETVVEYQPSRLLPEVVAKANGLALQKGIYLVDDHGDLLDDIPDWLTFDEATGNLLISTD